jgi:hypothetical protein
LGTESIRMAMGARALQSGMLGPANLPLPKAAAPPELPLPSFDESKVAVEPLAMRVPKECFYLRCARFDDFMWVREMLDGRGAELRTLLSGRASDLDLSKRLERQLALRTTDLAKRFGWAIVKDAAFIGCDTFFREGSSVGLLFQARNNALLREHIEGLRKEAMAGDASLKQSTVRILDWDAFLLEGPGNRVRSFYAQQGDFHLVTNSRWIVEGFLKTFTVPETALGSLPEFSYARSRVPCKEDGAFIYLSDPFFRKLVGPAARVEMQRRARSAAELQMLAIALQAARIEGSATPDLATLIRDGYLPKGFGTHVDGSALEVREGLSLDTLRGAMGTLTPFPDIPVASITVGEAQDYERFAEAYGNMWRNMDPVFGSLHRLKSPKERERLSLDLHISPYEKASYGLLWRFLGPPAPTTWRVSPTPGDLLHVDVAFGASMPDPDESSSRSDVNSREAPHLFGGIRDFTQPCYLFGGEVFRGPHGFEGMLASISGYLGEYGSSLLRLRMTGRGEGDQDAEGYSGPPRDNVNPDTEGPWKRIFGAFCVLGSSRKLLEQTTAQIRMVQAGRRAQLRLTLGEVAGTHVGGRIRLEHYVQDRRNSTGNALLLQSLSRQLRVGDPARTAQELLGGMPVCPLGGSYRLDPKCPERWLSSAWTEENLNAVNRVPEGYRDRPIECFHGLELEFSMDADVLQTRLELEVDP